LLQHDNARPHASLKARETITKFGCWVLPPSTLQPQSSTIRFPPIWRPEGCNPRYEVWDWWRCDWRSENLAMWAGQGIHTLVPHWRKAVEVDADFVQNCVWSQITPLPRKEYLLRKKNKGRYFLGNPRNCKGN
jgi:hypothetical protein